MRKMKNPSRDPEGQRRRKQLLLTFRLLSKFHLIVKMALFGIKANSKKSLLCWRRNDFVDHMDHAVFRFEIRLDHFGIIHSD